MTTKTITATAADILAKLTATRASIARAQEEAAELEKAAAWAAGTERRERLAAIRAEAEQDIDRSGDGADLARLLDELTQAGRRVHEAVNARNARIGKLRQRIVDEGVRSHTLGAIPPSPSDAGIGLTGDGLVVGEWHVRTVTAEGLIGVAVRAAMTGDAPEFAALDRLDQRVEMPSGRFWRAENGNVLAADNQPNASCVEVNRGEFLANAWGIDLDDLPTEFQPAEEVGAGRPAPSQSWRE